MGRTWKAEALMLVKPALVQKAVEVAQGKKEQDGVEEEAAKADAFRKRYPDIIIMVIIGSM